MGSSWACWALPEPLLLSWGNLVKCPVLMLTEDELCTWNFPKGKYFVAYFVVVV